MSSLKSYRLKLKKLNLLVLEETVKLLQSRVKLTNLQAV